MAQRQTSLLSHSQRKAAPVQITASHLLDLIQMLVHNVCHGQWGTCRKAGIVYNYPDIPEDYGLPQVNSL